MGMSGKWFANRGQVIQVVFAGCALVLAGISAYNVVGNHSISTGAKAVVFILGMLVAGLLLALVIQAASKHGAPPAAATLPPNFDLPSAPAPAPAPNFDTQLLSEVKLILIEAYPERADTMNYKMKERLRLRNDSPFCLDIRKPRWVRETNDDVSAKSPLGSSFQRVSLSDGKLEAETQDVHLHPDQTVLVWVGLDETLTPGDLELRHRSFRIGTLAFPLTVGGRTTEYGIRL